MYKTILFNVRSTRICLKKVSHLLVHMKHSETCEDKGFSDVNRNVCVTFVSRLLYLSDVTQFHQSITRTAMTQAEPSIGLCRYYKRALHLCNISSWDRECHISGSGSSHGQHILLDRKSETLIWWALRRRGLSVLHANRVGLDFKLGRCCVSLFTQVGICFLGFWGHNSGVHEMTLGLNVMMCCTSQMGWHPFVTFTSFSFWICCQSDP